MSEPCWDTQLSLGVPKCCFRTSVPGRWRHPAALAGGGGRAELHPALTHHQSRGWVGDPDSTSNLREGTQALGTNP